MDEARQRLLLDLNRAVATQQPLSVALAIVATELRPLLGEEGAHLFVRFGEKWSCRWSSDGRLEQTEWLAAVADHLSAELNPAGWTDPARGERCQAIPLLNRNEAVGYWLLTYPAESKLPSESLFLHELIAGQINAIVQRRRLNMKLRRRRRQLDLLYALSDANSSLKPLEATLADIHAQLNRAFAAAICLIALYDAESGVISFPYAANYNERLEVTNLTVDDPNSITAWVIRNNTPYTLDHWRDERRRPAPGILIGEMPQILICYPMQLRDSVVGAISIQGQDLFAFNEDDEALLAAVARHAGVAIQHARLFADARRRLRDMSALVNMAKQITGDLQLGPVMETTVRILQELFAARACAIALLTPEKEELIIEAAAGIDPQWIRTARMRVGEGVSGEAVLRRELVYVPDARDESDFLFFNPNLRSLLAVPLVSRDETLGALTLDSEQPNAFDESVIQLMTIAAAQVSVAIANARLYAESEERASRLVSANQELQAFNQLKSDLVGNVSHELRKPLAIGVTQAHLLMEGVWGEMTEIQRQKLQTLINGMRDLTRLVDDIMALHEIGPDNLQRESFALADLIRQSVEGAALINKKGQFQFEFEDQTTDSTISADRMRIGQVVTNLITNAVKFSPTGGCVRIALYQEGEALRFSVSDQGLGIPPDKQELIFTRFYQVDSSSSRRVGGAGIGLSIVKRIVDAHNGRIWVESELGKGSAFHVALPSGNPPLFDDD